jgi:hypothetical protein
MAVAAILTACEPQSGTEVTPDPTGPPLSTHTEQPPPQDPEPTPTPLPTPTPEPTPPPLPSIGRQSIDLARYYNGITIESEYLPEQGEETAATERLDNQAYVLEMRLRVRVPVAASTAEQIGANDPKLPHMLNDFELLLENAEISPAYQRLYENKVEWNRTRLGRLNDLLSRHNFYDCDTILNLRHPETGRRVILAMGDMDLNTDGSDGDRNYEVDSSSAFFLPQTSYRWRKQTDRPNPFLAREEKRLQELESEFAKPGLSIERNRELRAGIENAKRRIFDLKTYSFLISDTDPFIVLPGFMMRPEEGPDRPRFGDYALVIYDRKIYPAILGDAGPSFKFGEASMRLCREIQPATNAIRRAVSNLRVTYLVFPGTADESPGPPDLERWQEMCQMLLHEIGGSPVDLHHWENLVPPWPDEARDEEEPDSDNQQADSGEVSLEEAIKNE